jgi:hypothetical protein
MIMFAKKSHCEWGMCVGPRTSEAKAAFLGRLTARLKPCPPKNQSTLQFPRQIDPPVFFGNLTAL